MIQTSVQTCREIRNQISQQMAWSCLQTWCYEQTVQCTNQINFYQTYLAINSSELIPGHHTKWQKLQNPENSRNYKNPSGRDNIDVIATKAELPHQNMFQFPYAEFSTSTQSSVKQIRLVSFCEESTKKKTLHIFD